MRSQRIYTGYSVLIWFVILIFFILMYFSGNAYDVRNEALYLMICQLSRWIALILLIPIRTVLCIIASVQSARRQMQKQVVFNIATFFITSILIFVWFAYYCLLNGI